MEIYWSEIHVNLGNLFQLDNTSTQEPVKTWSFLRDFLGKTWTSFALTALKVSSPPLNQNDGRKETRNKSG